MINKKLTVFLAGFATVLLSMPFSANGATPDEAAEVARRYGYSEDEIQQAYNEYNLHPEQYPPEKIDQIIAKVEEASGGIVSVVPYNPDAKVPDSAVSTETTVVPDTTSSAETQGTESSETTPQNVVHDSENQDVEEQQNITLTLPDGTEFTRISTDKFIDLSYDEKMNYLSTFPPEQQQVIIDNLSPQEYRSITKQMPTEDKADYIDNLAEVAGEFDMNITVDEMTDDNIQISIRNSDGELTNVSKAGVLVENTGYDRRGIFAVAGLLFSSAFTGLFVLLKNCFSREEKYEGK